MTAEKSVPGEPEESLQSTSLPEYRAARAGLVAVGVSVVVAAESAAVIALMTNYPEMQTSIGIGTGVASIATFIGGCAALKMVSK